MKTLIALFLLATPASAATWWNDDGTRALVSGPVETDSFLYVPLLAPGAETACRVEKWETGSPTAAMKCDNGSAPMVEIISGGQMLFDGEMFTLGEE